METQRRRWFAAVLLLVVFNWASAAEKPEYVELGGTLALTLPATPSGPINNILWKFNGDLLAEWTNPNPNPGIFEYFNKFKGRTTLETDGRLEVKRMQKDDSGVYSVEINNVVQSDSYKVSVIAKVPKPLVLMRPLTCGSNSSNCTLMCDGDIKDAGDVTYSWKKGDEEWKEETDNIILITNHDELRHVKTFSCTMKNRVSQNESEPETNLLFRKGGSSAGLVVGTLFGVVAVAVAVAAGYYKREDLKSCFGLSKDNKRPEPGKDKKPDGAAQDDEKNPMNSPQDNP